MYSFAWTKPAMWFTQYRSDGRYTPGSSPGQARFRPPPPYPTIGSHPPVGWALTPSPRLGPLCQWPCRWSIRIRRLISGVDVTLMFPAAKLNHAGARGLDSCPPWCTGARYANRCSFRTLGLLKHKIAYAPTLGSENLSTRSTLLRKTFPFYHETADLPSSCSILALLVCCRLRCNPNVTRRAHCGN